MLYSEADLIIPALQVIEENPSGASTSLLIKELTDRMKPSGRDAKTLSGRKDTYFSQKVRNLKSHDSLMRRGLAAYQNGIWKITDKGTELLKSVPEFESLVLQGFGKRTIAREIERENVSEIIIEEGALETRTAKQRERSSRLREEAINEFRKIDSGLPCSACGFSFVKEYGEIGKDFIEVHHVEPMHEMEVFGGRIPLSEALKKVAPVCSNCHRMIHRKKNGMRSIDQIKEVISKAGLQKFP